MLSWAKMTQESPFRIYIDTQVSGLLIDQGRLLQLPENVQNMSNINYFVFCLTAENFRLNQLDSTIILSRPNMIKQQSWLVCSSPEWLSSQWVSSNDWWSSTLVVCQLSETEALALALVQLDKLYIKIQGLSAGSTMQEIEMFTKLNCWLFKAVRFKGSLWWKPK